MSRILTAAEILALLAADPALAVEVAAGLPGLRIAGPWKGMRRLDIYGVTLASVWQHGPTWRLWTTIAPHVRTERSAHTREEAQAAADDALVTAGWKLAP